MTATILHLTEFIGFSCQALEMLVQRWRKPPKTALSLSMRLLRSPTAIDKQFTRSLAAGVLVLVCLAPAWADPNLAGLDCVNVVVALTQDQTLVLSDATLRDALIARIQSKLPRLRIDRICANVLYFRILATMRTTESRRSLGYLAAVRLEMVRSAIMLDTMGKIEMTAWQDGKVLSGPSGDEQTAILDALDDLLGSFADAYGKAGNP